MTTLTTDQARTAVVESIARIAPDVADEIESLDPSVDLWEELELDSMDHVNVMTALTERTGVDIPERRYAELRSIGSLVDHLVGSTG